MWTIARPGPAARGSFLVVAGSPSVAASAPPAPTVRAALKTGLAPLARGALC